MKKALLFLTVAFMAACGRIVEESPSNTQSTANPTIEEELKGYWKLDKVSSDSNKSVADFKILNFRGSEETSLGIEFCSSYYHGGASSYTLDGRQLTFYVFKSTKKLIPDLKKIVVSITNISADALELNGNVVYKRVHRKMPNSPRDETTSLCSEPLI